MPIEKKLPVETSYALISEKYPNMTEFIKLQRAVSIPETETKDSNITRLAKKVLKEESCNLERDIKLLIARYHMSKQYKISNFKNYI